MECEGGSVVAAGGVGDSEHVEITLQHPVLARVAMDDDKGKLEAVDAWDGEVVSVDGDAVAIVGKAVPAFAVHNNLEDVVFLVVKVFVDLASAEDGNVVFARVSAHYKGYIRFVHDMLYLFSVVK